jgi:hypothetical protein
MYHRGRPWYRAGWVFPWRAQRGRGLEPTSHQMTQQRPREHAFGEDRGRAGEAEHPRVGASPVPGDRVAEGARCDPPPEAQVVVAHTVAQAVVEEHA